MNQGPHPAAENVLHLEQAIRLLGRLGNEQYTGQNDVPFRGGVGGQVRHTIDFYDCFLDGLRAARIDYSSRSRDLQVECERGLAAERIRDVIDRLGLLKEGDLQTELWVKPESCAPDLEDVAWSRSTVHRELQFLASHTVHHHALIVALLARQGVDCGPEFGVAPSTLRYWKESDQAVVLDAPDP